MIIVYSTFPNRKKAKEVAEKLIEKKLAGCVNIFPIEAIYSWQGKTEGGREFAAVIKTKKEKFRQVEKLILENHPDDTPCILEVPVGRVAKKYLSWLDKSVKQRSVA